MQSNKMFNVNNSRETPSVKYATIKTLLVDLCVKEVSFGRTYYYIFRFR